MTPSDDGRDYDRDPSRFSLVETCGLAGDSHKRIARRIIDERRSPVLDIGCGRGRLADHLTSASRWVGVDASVTQLRACQTRPVVAADATSLPLRDNTFGAATALWMLYHVRDPRAVLQEARRVLVPGGLFVACTDSREDAPELLWPRAPTPFDAEDAVSLVSTEFGQVEVEPWAAEVRLPDEAAVASFLRGMQIPAALRKPARPPLTVTKRGCIIWATA